MTEESIPNIIKLYDGAIKKLGPYKPDISKLQFNYLSKSSELKLRLTVPNDASRTERNILIPAHENYSISEIYDSTLTSVDVTPQLVGDNWVIKASSLPSSEHYLVTMLGTVTDDVIERLVRIDAPDDPDKTDDDDRYWIHSGIRDMSLLEDIYKELNIDDVQASVNVGVQRTFASSTPSEISGYIRAKIDMEKAISSRDRQLLFNEWQKLKGSRQKIKNLQTYQILEQIKKLLGPEKFRVYVNIDKPYKIHSVSYTDIGMPENVKVNVLTDLNKKIPAADGNLVFKKKAFSENVKYEFDELISDTKK